MHSWLRGEADEVEFADGRGVLEHAASFHAVAELLLPVALLLVFDKQVEMFFRLGLAFWALSSRLLLLHLLLQGFVLGGVVVPHHLFEAVVPGIDLALAFFVLLEKSDVRQHSVELG